MTDEFGFNEIKAIFRASFIDIFNLLNDALIDHKIICKFSYLASLYLLIVNGVDCRFGVIVKITKDFLDFQPRYLFFQDISIL